MKKTFALLVTMLFAVSSIVLAHPLVEEKESLVVYDNAGNEVASLPLEKKGAKNRSLYQKLKELWMPLLSTKMGM